MNEEAQNSLCIREEEISLLDLLVTLVENLKLLIIGPLLVGLCALGVTFVMPQTYQSVAVLHAEQATASLMVTAAVLDPVIAAFGLANDDTVEVARRKLGERIKTTVGRHDELLTLTVSGRTAQQAQALANAVLQQTYQASRPKGTVRARLEAQLAESQVRFKNAQDASVALLKRMDSNGAGPTSSAEMSRGYAELLNVIGVSKIQVSSLEIQLESMSEAQVIQPPTLPIKANGPKKGLLVIGATLTAALMLLLFVFLRQAQRSAVTDAKVAKKWAYIRESLSWRKVV